jgi:ParB-like chromosome segregation protein Spo0J
MRAGPRTLFPKAPHLEGPIMFIRDRIKDFRRIPARLLKPNPRNWRTHPEHQRDALRGILAEIGYADALLARELSDGSIELIDGHLRAETTPEAEVPVLILDLDDREAAKLLALLDPLAGLAETDRNALSELLADVHTDNAALRAVLEETLAASESADFEAENAPLPEVDIPAAFQVVVECRDEAQQREAYERLTAEGWKCRLLML